MNYLPALTSLRFMAAAMIVVHHTHGYFGYGTVLVNTLALDQGVSFFFVLSGFILFYTNRNITSMADALRFLAARIARIWPLHVATLFLTLLFVPQPWGPAGLALGPAFLNATLLQGWIPLPGYFFSFNAVSWSLSTELFFYLSFPALALNWQRTWPWKMALCATASAFMVAAAAAARLPFYDGTASLSIDALVYINPLARIFEFSIGLLAAHLWLTRQTMFSALPAVWATLLEACAVALVFLAMTVLKDAFATAFAHGWISASLLKWLLSAGSGPCFALLAIAFATQRGLLSAVLARRPFVLLGEISFALYMCHQILFRSLTASGTLAAFGPMRWQYAAYWAMALALSYGLFKLVEWPCRRAILVALKAGGRHPIAVPAP